MSSSNAVDALALFIEQARGIRPSARRGLAALVKQVRAELEREQRLRYSKLSAKIHRERMTVK